MQIVGNTTGMQADLCVAVDKAARDHCVVVVKGTFTPDDSGELRLAEVQRPLVYADEHHGDPATTSIRYESDFAFTKPYTDVLVQGHALAARGRALEKMVVRLELPGQRKKDVLITGDRHWERGFTGMKATPPRPFTRMPLVYERAFGGADHSHPEPKHHGTDLRNPVGLGFRKNPRAGDALGTALPNLEDPYNLLATWNGTPPPVGLGSLSRGWQPRLTYAGTYDARWFEEHFPFLSENFDLRHFQSAPEDQQFPHLKGGEVLRIHGMTETGVWTVKLPSVSVPLTFRFHDRELAARPCMDTVLIDCDTREVVLTWRACAPLGKKLTLLREIVVGPEPRLTASTFVEYRNGKPYFRGLAALIAWRRSQERQRGSK